MPVKESGKRAKLLKILFRDRNTAASPTPSPSQSIANVQSPEQEDIERITKASSDAIELYAPSKPSAAADVQTTAGTDAGGKEPHHPAAASTLEYTPKSPPSDNAQKHVVLSIEPRAEESQPAPDPTQQQSPALSTSQRLWNAAYDRLEEDNSKLVGSYIQTLANVLKTKASEESISDADNVAAELKDPSKRQTYMKMLAEEGQARFVKASKVTKGVGSFAKAILSVKPIIDIVIQNIPQAAPAALPWGGVCIGLQILSNPAGATQSNLEGITHVVSRMEWYCALTEHLLNKKNIVIGDESFEVVLEQLEKAVITLYKALLLYQMKSVCSYYQKRHVVFFRGLVNLDDWDGDLKSVTIAEDVIRTYSEEYHNEYKTSALHQSVDSSKKIEELLGDIRQDIRHFISQQKDIRRDDMETACRKDLRVVDPQHDMERIEKSKDKLLDDAYKWILGTKEYAAFTNWDNSGPDFSSCRLLWIKGHAGTGKTMLMIGIIRELSYQPVVLSPKLSFFFCQGTDTDLSNAIAVLRSLIWLLLIQQPHLISHLLQKYNESGADLFKDRNAFYALSEVFQNMLKDPQLSPVYFAVDALDECEQGLSDLIQLISTSLTLSERVKWLVSSRPNVKLNNPHTIGKLLELDAQSLERPVNAYIDHKLLALNERDGYDKDTLAKVSSAIRQRAKNTFLWVALVFKRLDSIEGWYAAEIIEEIPSGLSELYSHMMKRIEDGQMRDPEYCKNVLVATSLAFRPLSLSELIVVAGLPPQIKPQNIVDKCGSFLITNEKTVYLIHQSAKDYLEKNYKSRLQLAGVAQGHVDISRRSIDAMSSMLVKNAYALPLGFKPKDIRPPDPDPLAPIRYSCVFWADHLCSLKGESPGCKTELMDDARVFSFLKERFLRWIESLSLLGKLSDGVQSIRKLLHIAQLQAGISPQLIGFLKDAEKFVLNHGSIIERAPLQTYVSALVFSPVMSEVRNKQWKERLLFIRNVKGIRDRWSAHQQTLEGHSGRVWSVAFSPDGTTLASASVDKTVRLWDTTTGAHKQTLEGHSGRVWSVAFSPDGTTLASASDDKTVRLWDTATGAHKQTLEGHSGTVNSVAFSPDGTTLASASDDKTVRLWNTATGAHKQTLEGHSGTVNSVAFSPDGTTLASASDDKTVQLWDTATGAHKQTLEGHSGTVNSVAFSPDGTTLASASDDETVQLWDTATGAHKQTLEGHSGKVWSVAFSPDGTTLVSASDDETVQLWDTATGAHKQTLEGHSGIVWSVAFSPDGTTLASASVDKTVRLWNTATGAHKQTLEGHSGIVWSVAFSPDGTTLASASDDKTVRLWNTTTGAHKQTLEGYSGRVWSVAFSPDGTTLASASVDKTVRLWDTTTGAHKQTLEGHSGIVWSVAFSPDGTTLASASDDETVRLWNTATGAHKQTLEGHSGTVNSVAFSPDGTTLASASDDETVQLWDTATGAHKQTLEGHSGKVWSVAFSPDGTTLASASDDKTVRLWNTATGAHKQTLEGHSGRVWSVAFSPDGTTLASASDDKTVRLWNTTTGAHKQTLEGHSGRVWSVAFSPDGTTLASASVDKTVRLWDTTTGAHKQTLEVDLAIRQLSYSSDGSCLYTDRGVLNITCGIASPSLPSATPALFVKEQWIVCGSKTLLWLPPDYRATSVAVFKGIIALGHASGRVSIIEFIVDRES